MTTLEEFVNTVLADYEKLKHSKASMQHLMLFYYRTKKYTNYITSVDACINIVTDALSRYAAAQKNDYNYLQSFYLECQELMYREGYNHLTLFEKSKVFGFIPRFVYGYNNAIKKCINLLNKLYVKIRGPANE